MLAIATSIDALAVGITFAFLQVKIAPAVCLIGITTFIISFAGVGIGLSLIHILTHFHIHKVFYKKYIYPTFLTFQYKAFQSKAGRQGICNYSFVTYE